MNAVYFIPQPPKPPPLRAAPAYCELISTSNFSFLRGGSHPEELVAAAASLGLKGVGLCDRNSFAGVVRAYVAMKDLHEKHPDFRYFAGVRLVFADATPDIIAYPTDLAAYGRLCKLLTDGNGRAEKGSCTLYLSDLLAYAEGQLLIVQANEDDWEGSETALRTLATSHGRGNVWLAAYCRYNGEDRARLNRLADLAQRCGVKLIASNDVLYHTPERRPLQDVVTCIRQGITIIEAGRRLEKNAERHLKPPEEMQRLFREHPDAIRQTTRFADRIGFSLSQLEYNYPEETIGNGETAQQTLQRLAWEGAAKRYPEGIPDKVKHGLDHELALIAQMNYAAYFLTVHDLVRFAREERGILCQGRGSAANSAVCFCLGVTEVNPTKVDLLFERFVSTERDEPPDIDVDFEHERREEVMQYLYTKYGRERCGLTSTVVTYRTKGAVREIGKVFGLSVDLIESLNGLAWGWHDSGLKPDRIAELGVDPHDPVLSGVLALVSELIGFPRHLSQHTGGFVITRDRLDHLVPIGKTAMDSRTIVEWNKDDLDALKMLKVDVLALGMLTCLRRGFELMHQYYGVDLTLAGVMENEEDCVYRMTHRADTLGVFQIESRAQMSMLPRLKPSRFYDLVIEVAIVRPGPIQGDMVHPYLRRRQGLEPTTFPSAELEAVLSKTYGVPLFQEQAMKIAIVAAGFTPGEADRLRRAMATFKRNGTIGTFRTKMVEGMIGRGYEREFAERCFAQIEGFGEYGFPESHAASFALLVYVSCWLKCHYPDVFACALLNSQPMGFYAPAQIVRDAREHGVEMRDVDINLSDLECVLEPGTPAGPRVWARHAEMRDDIRTTHAVRLGLGYVKGLKHDDANRIVARRGRGYDSVRDLWLRTGLGPAVLEKLAAADAFGSLGLTRREALWAIRGLAGSDGAQTLPLFAAMPLLPQQDEPERDLPPMPMGEEVIHDYRALTLSLKAHPVSFLRPVLTQRGIVACAQLGTLQPGRLITVAGLVLVRQRPGTAAGVIFASLEDETGIANIIVWPKVFEQYRRQVLGARLLGVRGELQREGLVIHVIARELIDLTPDLLALSSGYDIGVATIAHADEGRTGPHGSRIPKTARDASEMMQRAYEAMPKGRNFH